MKSKLLPTIRFFFSRKKEPYFSLYRILGFIPYRISLYNLAMLHKSAHIRQAGGRILSNERLEYLGDSVLETVVSDILYSKYPDKSEGELTNIRARIVQRATLDKVALEIGLDKLVFTNKKCTQNFSKVHINGNAFEALMGAIYLDRGYKKCQQFFEKLIKDGTINIEKAARVDINFKSKLIEWAQRFKYRFEFKTENEDFCRETNVTTFTSSVYIEDIKVGEGAGTSKKESQQVASQKALKALKNKEIREKIAQKHHEYETTETSTTPEPADI